MQESQGAPHPRHKRRFRNYLLDVRIQTRLGLVSVAIAATFMVCAWLVVSLEFGRLAETIIELTDVPDEVRELLGSSLNTTYLALGGMALFFALANILVSVLYTHRLVGPTIAFRRHIQRLTKGDYAARTVLRKRDFFVEVAEDLNELARVLEERAKAGEKTHPADAQAPGQTPESD